MRITTLLTAGALFFVSACSHVRIPQGAAMAGADGAVHQAEIRITQVGGRMSLAMPDGMQLVLDNEESFAEAVGLAKDVSRGFFAWQSLKTWTKADVAKHSESERTVRAGIEETAATNREVIGATERSLPTVTNPERNAAGAGVLRGLFRR